MQTASLYHVSVKWDVNGFINNWNSRRIYCQLVKYWQVLITVPTDILTIQQALK